MIRRFRPRRLTITEAAVEKVMPMVQHDPESLLAWDVIRLVQACAVQRFGKIRCMQCGLDSDNATEPTNHGADCPCRAVLEDVRGFLTREEGQ